MHQLLCLEYRSFSIAQFALKMARSTSGSIAAKCFTAASRETEMYD